MLPAELVVPCAQRRVEMFQESSRFVVVTRYKNVLVIKESNVQISGVSIIGFDPDLQIKSLCRSGELESVVLLCFSALVFSTPVRNRLPSFLQRGREKERERERVVGRAAPPTCMHKYTSKPTRELVRRPRATATPPPQPPPYPGRRWID